MMHNRNIMSFLGWLCGITGWWLWNLVLSDIYNPATSFYGVKGGFVERFGRSALWWLTVIVGTAAALLWEVGVESVRIAWWPSEVDIFQELEQDPVWKRRFGEMARGEWEREGERGE